MLRRVYVFDRTVGRVVPIEERTPLEKKESFQIITDEIDPVRNPVTREFVTSKSRLRQFYKERGYEEVGNEMPQHSDRLRDHLGELKERGEW